jgi:acetolactate synthase I/II/III large subunit
MGNLSERAGVVPASRELDPPAPEEWRPPIVHSVRGADLLVDMLEQAGVDVVFGLPGGAISPVHDALLDGGLRVITTRHESGAMFAATAYARSTGKLAAVAVTSGPGMLNSMTGLATAWCDGVPVLLLVGEVPHQVQGKGALQDGSAHGLQLVEMARNVAKLAVEVPRPSALPHLLRRAISTAQSGRPGPVVLTLPLDVTTALINAPRCGGNTTTRETVDPDLINEIGTLVMSAKRPLILAGSGARGDGAPARLLAVAERLGCPVATTPKGKGVFPEDHPLALGVFGLGGHRSARGYLDAGADVVLAIGTSLGDLATDGFAPQLQAPALIHVDIDARQIGKSYSPTHTVVASARGFLGAFAERLAELRTPPRAVHGGIIRHVLPSSSKPGWIASHDVLREIQQVVPSDTIYTVDSGEHYMFAVHYLQINHADSFLAMSGLGSMGPSIGAAIGAQLAYPDRFCAALCGDGCFAMNAFEIATAVAEELPIRVFVFNDERLSMVENGHQSVYGRSPSYSTRPLDICAIAQGLGATAMRISRAGALRALSDTLLHTRGPLVVEVRIDHEILLPKRDRVSAMAPR